jgi:hypothetical protein
MLLYFEGLKVKRQQVFELLGVKGIEDITADHLVTLRGIANAIRDNETTVDEVFPLQPVPLPRAKSEPARNAELPLEKNATIAEAMKYLNEQDIQTLNAEFGSVGDMTPDKVDAWLKRANTLIDARASATTKKTAK